MRLCTICISCMELPLVAQKERDSCPNRPQTASKFRLLRANAPCANPPAQTTPDDPDCSQPGRYRQRNLSKCLAQKYPNSFSQNTEERRGIREFVVGTGDKNSHRVSSTTQPNSQVRRGDTFGVLESKFHATSYDWEFFPDAGRTFIDSGSWAATSSTHSGRHQVQSAIAFEHIKSAPTVPTLPRAENHGIRQKVLPSANRI